MDFEIEAHHLDHRARLSITDSRLTPGQRYRVTVTPADAPKPEPTLWGLRDTAGWCLLTSSEKEARSTALRGPGVDVVPLYEHPPPADAPEPDPRGYLVVLPTGRAEWFHTKYAAAKFAAAMDSTVMPLYDHPPALTALEIGTRMHDRIEQEFKRKPETLDAIEDAIESPANETLAERMHREGWRASGCSFRYAVRSVSEHAEQGMWLPFVLWQEMRELETPQAVKIARQLHSEGWVLAEGGALRAERAGQWTPLRADVFDAMREIEEQEEDK